MGHYELYPIWEVQKVRHSHPMLALAGHTEERRVLIQKYRWVETDNFGAIAYSYAERAWGASWRYQTREAAEWAAKEHCAGYSPTILAWGYRCWLALATGDDIEAGWGRSREIAEQMARRRAGHSKLETSFYTAEGV